MIPYNKLSHFNYYELSLLAAIGCTLQFCAPKKIQIDLPFPELTQLFTGHLVGTVFMSTTEDIANSL